MGSLKELLRKARRQKRCFASLKLDERLKGASPQCVSLVIDCLRYCNDGNPPGFGIKLTEHLPASLAVPILLSIYQSNESDTAYDVIGALEKHRHPKVLPVLVKALRAKDPLVRANAAEVLGARKERRAMKHLVRALKSDPDSIARSCAAFALGELGDRSVEVELKKALRKESQRNVRLRIMAGLWILGDHNFLPAVLSFLSDTNYRNRCAAVNILIFAKKKEIATVVRALNNLLRIEPTLAVRSTIRTAMQDLRKQ